MKYYYQEHILGYQKVKEEGKTAWAEIHGYSGFENFASRAFWEEILPRLNFSDPAPIVLEYGCGTGPGACFLAEKGFRVDGIDIIPMAIDMAIEFAQKRNLDIHYEVQDICELPPEGKKYDLIVDSYCLQCIVTTEDRDRVFSTVQSRLRPDGYYLISTAMFKEEDYYEDKRIKDVNTGIGYSSYGENRIIDIKSGIVLDRQNEKPDDLKNAIMIKDVWYLPIRRHWKAKDLKLELEVAGFDIKYQDEGLGGNVVCVIRSPSTNKK